MRLTKKLLLGSAFLFATTTAFAQQPPRGGQRGGEREQAKPAEGNIVTQMMAFDKDKDGKLKKDEVTDERLARLFDRADANKDGTVTKEELEALAKEDTGRGGQGGPGGPGGPGGGRGGQGGPGGPGGGRGGEGGFPGGPGGPGGFGGGRGGFGGMPQPGQILPAFMADQLKLTDDQKKKLDELQKETDTKLEKLLTDDQKKQLKEIKERGPMGPGGGRGGPGGPGGGRGPGGDR